VAICVLAQRENGLPQASVMSQTSALMKETWQAAKEEMEIKETMLAEAQLEAAQRLASFEEEMLTPAARAAYDAGLVLLEQKEYLQAMRQLRVAADIGHRTAMYQLGWMYEVSLLSFPLLAEDDCSHLL
jgi:TPR repeat protein